MDRTHPDSGQVIKDGGPAFPVPDQGMTLRDWFAGQALIVFASEYVHDNSDVIADQAYTLADAMLKAREVLNGN